MFPRVVHEDTELGGVHLPAGSRIGVLIASANRDERHWEDPDRFDLRRATVRHSRSPAGRTSAPARTSRASRSRTPRYPRCWRCPASASPSADVRYQGWVFRGPARLDVTWKGRA